LAGCNTAWLGSLPAWRGARGRREGDVIGPRCRLQAVSTDSFDFGDTGERTKEEPETMQIRKPYEVPKTWDRERVEMKVLQYPHPALRKRTVEWTDFESSRLKMLGINLLDSMYRRDGVGMAAPQLGINFKVIVFNPTPENVRAGRVMANPKIVSASPETTEDVEGCLSVTGMTETVVRHKSVEVEYQNMKGAVTKTKLSDYAARIFQHEYDHLRGNIYTDRVADKSQAGTNNLIKLERAFDMYEAPEGLEPAKDGPRPWKASDSDFDS